MHVITQTEAGVKMRNRDFNRSINRPYSFLKALNDNVSKYLYCMHINLDYISVCCVVCYTMLFIFNLGSFDFANPCSRRWTLVKVI